MKNKDGMLNALNAAIHFAQTAKDSILFSDELNSEAEIAIVNLAMKVNQIVEVAKLELLYEKIMTEVSK